MSYASDSSDLQTACILCNGPSLRGFNFAQNLRGHTTFGMNAAYRYWDTIGWYPHYYSCLDVVVGVSHKEAIARLIHDSESLGIKRFLLRKNLVDALGEAGHADHVDCLETLCERNPALFHSKRITTGSHTLLWAAYLGYRNLILLGADARYTEILNEARPIGNNRLRMESTPRHNPNYFFDGYQQAGDEYHIPNPASEKGDFVHKAAWGTIRPALDALDAVVVNANPLSEIEDFPRVPFDEATRAVQDERQKRLSRLEHFASVDGFPREAGAHIDELKILYPFLPKQDGLMLDVGAHHGESCIRFLRRGWTVYAFEPDPDVRRDLEKRTRDQRRIIIDSRAVSRVGGREYPWFTTPDSSGAGSMRPFSATHEQVGSVTTVTLTDIVNQYDIQRIDLLKIDAEGFDFMVLQGFPFARLRPDFIICEFEDAKTLPLGCTTAEMADILQRQGYTLYISEWHPIIRYGIRHQWHGFRPWPSALHDPSAWGNIIAFASPPDEETLRNRVKDVIQMEKPVISEGSHA